MCELAFVGDARWPVRQPAAAGSVGPSPRWSRSTRRAPTPARPPLATARRTIAVQPLDISAVWPATVTQGAPSIFEVSYVNPAASSFLNPAAAFPGATTPGATAGVGCPRRRPPLGATVEWSMDRSRPRGRSLRWQPSSGGNPAVWQLPARQACRPASTVNSMVCVSWWRRARPRRCSPRRSAGQAPPPTRRSVGSGSSPRRSRPVCRWPSRVSECAPRRPFRGSVGRGRARVAGAVSVDRTERDGPRPPRAGSARRMAADEPDPVRCC